MVNWNIRNKLQWNFNRNSIIFIQEHAFESVVCVIAVILSRPLYVKFWSCHPYIIQIKLSFYHQPHNYLLNRLFRRRSTKTSKLRVTGLCAGNSPVADDFPAQRASNAENVSIWLSHHDTTYVYDINPWKSFDISSIVPDIRFLRPPYLCNGNPHSNENVLKKISMRDKEHEHMVSIGSSRRFIPTASEILSDVIRSTKMHSKYLIRNISRCVSHCSHHSAHIGVWKGRLQNGAHLIRYKYSSISIYNKWLARSCKTGKTLHDARSY